MQPKSEHTASTGGSTSRHTMPASTSGNQSPATAAATAAVALPQEAPVIGVRTLLEFVAWLVSTTSQDGGSNSHKARQKEAVGPASAGRKGPLFLMDELSAVGVAVRRMQVSWSATT